MGLRHGNRAFVTNHALLPLGVEQVQRELYTFSQVAGPAL
jgi:hypothetical protein